MVELRKRTADTASGIAQVVTAYDFHFPPRKSRFCLRRIINKDCLQQNTLLYMAGRTCLGQYSDANESVPYFSRRRYRRSALPLEDFKHPLVSGQDLTQGQYLSFCSSFLGIFYRSPPEVDQIDQLVSCPMTTLSPSQDV
jgi:hypothetical protein